MRNLILSPSSLDTIQECHQQWHLSRQLLLRGNEPNPNLDRGTLVHFMLEEYYKTILSDPAIDRAQLMEDVLHKAAIKRVNLTLEDGTWDNIERSWREYVIFYTNDWTPVQIEQPFSKVLFEDASLDLRVIMEGKIDLIAKLSTGEHLVIDHKSVARDDRIFQKMDNQPACYAWATGYRTVLINKFGVQKTKKPVEKFGRVSMSYTQSNIDDWVESATVHSLRLAQAIEAGVYTRSFNACRFCGYKIICGAIPEAREFVMKTQYRLNTRFDLFDRE